MFDELGNPKQMYDCGTNKSFNDNNDARDDIFVKSKALNSTFVSLCEVLSIKIPSAFFLFPFIDTQTFLLQPSVEMLNRYICIYFSGLPKCPTVWFVT